MPYKDVDSTWGIAKSIAIAVASWITSIFIYFEPIHTLWLVVGVTWAVNFLFGYVASMRTQGEIFNLQKAMNTMREAVIYFALTALFFFVGERMEDESFILKALNILTWAFFYFYAINILKNANRICPGNGAIKYFYLLASLTFLRRLPFYRNYEEVEE